MQAITDAQGWAGILSAFRSDGAPPIDAKDLLPFPDEFEDEGARISHKTARMLKQLVDEAKLPSQIIAEASQFILQAQKIR